MKGSLGVHLLVPWCGASLLLQFCLPKVLGFFPSFLKAKLEAWFSRFRGLSRVASPGSENDQRDELLTWLSLTNQLCDQEEATTDTKPKNDEIDREQMVYQKRVLDQGLRPCWSYGYQAKQTEAESF